MKGTRKAGATLEKNHRSQEDSGDLRGGGRQTKKQFMGPSPKELEE